MEIETSEQLAFYVDTLKTLYEHANRENNAAVCAFLKRFLDGHLSRAAMLSLMLDDTAAAPVTHGEQHLAAVATIMTAPIAPLPPNDGSGGIKAKLPDNPPPRSPSPVTARW
jgi:hypothetical protein